MRKIPERIFYISFGNGNSGLFPHCLKSWQKYMPDAEIVKISDSPNPYFDLQREMAECTWLHAAYARRCWAFASDYARIKLLHDHGGIYLDTDMRLLAPLTRFLEHSCFAGLESPMFVNGAIIGATKGHPLLAALIDFYRHGIWKSAMFTIPEILTSFIRSMYGFCPFDSRLKKKVTALEDGLVIYPENYFYPWRHNEPGPAPVSDRHTHAVHLWEKSWHSPATVSFIQEKTRSASKARTFYDNKNWIVRIAVGFAGKIFSAEKSGCVWRFHLFGFFVPLLIFHFCGITRFLVIKKGRLS